MAAQQTPYSSPAVHAYANELKAWREEAKLNKAELARLLGYSAQYIGQIEDSRNKPARAFAEDCDTFFKTNGVFLRLWKNIHDHRQVTILPPGFAEYLEREPQATTVKLYSALLMPGLIQTPEVIDVIMAKVRDPEIGAERARQRLERQTAVLSQEEPPQIFLVLDEGVLRRVVGGVENHRAQLQRLLDFAAQPNVMFQAVPLSSDYHPGLFGSFNLLGFKDGSQAAYAEAPRTGIFFDEPVRAAEYAVEYDLIRGHALREDESFALVRAAMEGL